MDRKILFTIPTLAPTDSKLPRVLSLCKELVRKQYKPYVSVDHCNRLHPSGVDRLNRLGVPVLVLRMTPHKDSPLISFIELFRTAYLLKQEKFTIQHSFDYSRWWFEPLVAKLGGVKYWVTTKANTDCNGVHWRLRLGLADKVIAQSQQMAQLLGEEVSSISDKITIVPNGVDSNTFQPFSKNHHLYAQLDFSSDSLILGCIAHLAPHKDHPSLLYALADAKNKNVELLIVGRTVNSLYEERLKVKVRHLGLSNRVHFLGLRQDIVELHSIMDGIVLTSREESLSNAVLEGMSSGLPVISSDCGGMPDAVQNGVNGWLVPRGNNFVAKLTDAIDDWATNPEKRKAYGEASRKIVLEKFSLSHMIRGHIELYESLLS